MWRVSRVGFSPSARTPKFSCSMLFEKRFAVFLLVGGVNTLFGYGLFALLMFFGVHYALALFVATIVGVIFNFKSTGALVFESSDNRLVLRFILGYVVVYLFNLAGIRCLEALGVGAIVGAAFMMLPAAVLSYILNSRFVFGRCAN